MLIQILGVDVNLEALNTYINSLFRILTISRQIALYLNNAPKDFYSGLSVESAQEKYQKKLNEKSESITYHKEVLRLFEESHPKEVVDYIKAYYAPERMTKETTHL